MSNTAKSEAENFAGPDISRDEAEAKEFLDELMQICRDRKRAVRTLNAIANYVAEKWPALKLDDFKKMRRYMAKNYPDVYKDYYAK